MPVMGNAKDLKPGSRCPKCEEGQLAGPIYTRHDHDRRTAVAGAGIPHGEALAYDCSKCGWRGLLTPCKDAEK